MLLGAVIGNIIGSPYSSPKTEIKSKEFPLVSDTSHFTNDSVMTMAIADALMNWKKGEEINDVIFEREVVRSMRDFAGQYRHLSHSFSFVKWLMSPNPRPYGSKGNGSAMRVSPVAWYFDDLWSVEHFAEITARVTHNRECDDTYIKISEGRDAQDCAINQGVFYGGGRQTQKVKAVVEVL